MLTSSRTTYGCGTSTSLSPRSAASASTPSRTTTKGLAMRCCRKARWMASASMASSSTRRRVTLFTSKTLGVYLCGPCEPEHSPPPLAGLDPHPPAPALDRFLDDREPHAAAFHLVSRAEGLEQAEHAVPVLGRDARPVVGDRELRPVAVHPGRHRHAPVRSVVVLDSIRDEVANDERQRRPRAHERL